ncbi:MAG: isoprenylcysteine carboxylmethyltransferase family protein [Anaerolineales bacterium]|nr:isoprenylcysteine carboxylmethyltransferase family protein [Anaerolineales bacterium]
MKLFLLSYFVVFYGFAFVWRSYITWRTTGVNPYRLGEQKGLNGFLARLYRLVSVSLALVVVVYSLMPVSWYTYFAPIKWLEVTSITVTGTLLLISAFVWILIAQAHMGNSWRIGIDEKHETALVTKGFFRLSRNPIFLGMRLNLLGLFLVIPNALTLVLWLLGDVAIQMQVFLEEDFLQAQHGETYARYRTMTPRYFGYPKQ